MSINRLSCIVSLIVLLFFTGSCDMNADDRHEIRLVLTKYIDAKVNNIGSECIKYVDFQTIKYYGYILSLVKCADSNTVASLRTDQKLMVLVARHTLTREKIRQMDARSFFEFHVQSSEANKALDKAMIDVISVHGKRASVSVLDSSGKPGISIEFVKEKDGWKIDIMAALNGNGKKALKELFRQRAEEAGMTETEYIYYFLESTNDVKPNHSIWEPHCND